MALIGITQQKLEEILSTCLNQIFENQKVKINQSEIVNKNYKVKEAAKISRCSEQTIYKKIKNGDLKATRFGRKYLIDHSELFNDRNEVKSMKFKR